MITVSLETAKKLKEAGWTEPTYFMYTEEGVRIDQGYIKHSQGGLLSGTILIGSYKAPTAEEILDDLYNRGRKPLLWIYPNVGRRTVQLDEFGDINDDSPQRNEDTIAEGVAKYWLRCKENNHLT